MLNGLRVIGILRVRMSHLSRGAIRARALRGVLFNFADIECCGMGPFFALSRFLKSKARF